MLQDRIYSSMVVNTWDKRLRAFFFLGKSSLTWCQSLDQFVQLRMLVQRRALTVIPVSWINLDVSNVTLD